MKEIFHVVSFHGGLLCLLISVHFFTMFVRLHFHEKSKSRKAAVFG